MLDLKKEKVLIIAPHVDDEVIGCAGLINKVKESGGRVYVLFLTNGNTKDFSKTGVSSFKERHNEVEKVARYLKFDDFEIAFNGSDQHLRLDKMSQFRLINLIERGAKISIESIKPTTILTPSQVSYNQDHRAAAYATFASCRPACRKLKHRVHTFLLYESPADQWCIERKFTPNFFLEMTRKQVDNKLHALKLYKSQLRNSSNPRSPDSIVSLARLRGAQSGGVFAEAFYCHRFLL